MNAKSFYSSDLTKIDTQTYVIFSLFEYYRYCQNNLLMDVMARKFIVNDFIDIIISFNHVIKSDQGCQLLTSLSISDVRICGSSFLCHCTLNTYRENKQLYVTLSSLNLLFLLFSPLFVDQIFVQVIKTKINWIWKLQLVTSLNNVKRRTLYRSYKTSPAVLYFWTSLSANLHSFESVWVLAPKTLLWFCSPGLIQDKMSTDNVSKVQRLFPGTMLRAK